MSTTAREVGARIDGVEASAYEVPTATEQESDGTLIWDSTTVVVVEVHCGDHTGLGYTYCDPSAAQVVQSKLAGVLEDADPLMPQKAWAQMQMQARQLGNVGIAAMAISAVDVALWDLKAKLLGVCLADALPRYRESVPIYGSGGFCNYSHEQLREQVRQWVASGFRSVKIKVGRDADADPQRVELVRSVAGPDVEVMVDANGANNAQDALEWARRYRELGVTYFEEPVSSDDLDGLAYVRERAPAGRCHPLRRDHQHAAGRRHVQGAQPAVLGPLRAGDLRASVLRDGDRGAHRVFLRPLPDREHAVRGHAGA
jgi:L-alanine-DL-glutamate epimerase-like enolase superfamily enzyme